MIRIRLFGGPELESDQPALAEQILRQPKPLALLSYLAHRHQFVSRATLLAMFWPELDEERGRAALRKTVFLIRRDLQEDVMVNQGDGLAVLDERLWCDTVAFRERLRTGERAEALELYTGEMLPGFYITGAADFGWWVDAERSNLQVAAERAALELARDNLAAEDWEAVLRWGRKAREISPSDDEGAYLVVMAHHRMGNHSQALEKFERFTRQLRAEYGIAPSPRLQELASSIRAGARRGAVGHGSAATVPEEQSEETPAQQDRLATRYTRFVDRAVDIMYETDARGYFTWTNPAVERILGYSPSELTDRRYLDLVREDYRDPTLTFYMRQLLERNPSTYYELPVLCANGREVWLGQNAQLVEDRGAPLSVQVVARDISTQVRVAEAQRNLALRDHVTDLYSPRGFHALAEDRIRLARRTDHQLILLCAHANGVDGGAVDRDLTSLARMLESTFRGSDVVARVEDRNFAVLVLERIDRDAAVWLHAVAERLRGAAGEQGLPSHLSLDLCICFAGSAQDCTAERLLAEAAASRAQGPVPITVGQGAGSRVARAVRYARRTVIRA